MSRERRTQEIPALGEKGDGPLLFMVAGEPSGDALGARLMTALKQAGGGPVRFAGVGGPLMEAEGLASLFPMGELAVMGLVEILPHAPRLLRRLGQTAAEICRLEPDAVVTIDSPGFSFRLAQRLRGSRILHVHYVAPQLWAWRPERGKKIAQRIDHLMALLPFEPAFFEVFGLACSFVGHPVIEAIFTILHCADQIDVISHVVHIGFKYESYRVPINLCEVFTANHWEKLSDPGEHTG